MQRAHEFATIISDHKFKAAGECWTQNPNMASHTSHSNTRLTSIPRSVEQITKAAQDYDYSALVPLHYWLRTARALLKEV